MFAHLSARRTGKTTQLIECWRAMRQQHPNTVIVLYTFSAQRRKQLIQQYRLTEGEAECLWLPPLDTARGGPARKPDVVLVDDIDVILSRLFGVVPTLVVGTGRVLAGGMPGSIVVDDDTGTKMALVKESAPQQRLSSGPDGSGAPEPGSNPHE